MTPKKSNYSRLVIRIALTVAGVLTAVLTLSSSCRH